MKALIIAGGFGTRLRPLTETIPKSLLPIANRPFLEHQVRLLLAHGISDVVLLTGYLPQDFEAFAASMATLGARLTISTEQTPLDTAGAVRSQRDALEDTTLVLNGDVLTAVDVSALVEAHRSAGATATLYLRPVADVSAYGVVPLDADGRVQAFREKPPVEEFPDGGLINAGLYVLEPRALDPVPADRPWSFERQLFPDLLAAGEPMLGFPSDAYWIDIGTPQRYLQAHADIMAGRVEVAVDGHLLTDARSFSDGTAILPPVILQHAPVGPGATIGPNVCIGAGSRIGAGATIEGSVVHEGVAVGADAVVRDSIVGRGVQVPEGASVVGEVLA